MRAGARTKGYMKNLGSGTIKEFLYNPSSYSTNRQMNYQELTAPGISYPQFQFVSGGAKEISFTLFLYGNKGEPKDFINFLNGFLPVEKSNSPFRKPPEMLFAYGAYIKKCILVGFSEEYIQFNEDLTPKIVEVALTLKVVA